MSIEPNTPQPASPPLSSSDLLGCFWIITLIAWLVVLILWIRQLGVYNKAYRKYQQSCREYEEANGQPSEELRLLQERLGNINKNPGVILKSLRRLQVIT